jgi:tetratricopeptide (TPR) repeat protein
MSAEEVETSVIGELRGHAVPETNSFIGTPDVASRQLLIANPNYLVTTPHPANAGTQPTVSVTQLRHKVPKEAKNAFIRAEKSSLAGNHEGAAQELERAIARDPDFSAAHGGLGAEYALLTRYAEAEGHFKRAIALDPATACNYYNLGLLYFQTGDTLAAEMNVRQALRLPTSEPSAHLLLAYILMPDPAKRDEMERHLRYAARTIPQAGYLLQKLQGGAAAPHS